MEKEYPVLIGGTDEQLEYEKCALCDSDAMLGHGDKGYCGGHYIEVMGWDVTVEDEQGPDTAPEFCGEQPIEDPQEVSNVED